MGSQVPTSEPQEINKIGLIIIIVGSQLLYVKIFTRLVLRVESSFLLQPAFNTSPKPHLQKVLLRYHTCDLGLETRVKWYVPTSMLSTTKIARIDLK